MLFKATFADFADGGLEAPALTMDVMLPVTEWPARMVDRVLDVSDEIVERGRGMNSIVSEKPTRGLGKPSNEIVPRWMGGDAEFSRGVMLMAFDLAPSAEGSSSDGDDAIEGVVGALLPLPSFADFMIVETS